MKDRTREDDVLRWVNGILVEEARRWHKGGATMYSRELFAIARRIQQRRDEVVPGAAETWWLRALDADGSGNDSGPYTDVERGVVEPFVTWLKLRVPKCLFAWTRPPQPGQGESGRRPRGVS